MSRHISDALPIREPTASANRTFNLFYYLSSHFRYCYISRHFLFYYLSAHFIIFGGTICKPPTLIYIFPPARRFPYSVLFGLPVSFRESFRLPTLTQTSDNRKYLLVVDSRQALPTRQSPLQQNRITHKRLGLPAVCKNYPLRTTLTVSLVQRGSFYSSGSPLSTSRKNGLS